MMIILNDPRCTLVEADTFEVLPTLPDNFAGLICTDPPYGKHTHAKFGAERRADGATPRGDLAFKHLERAQIASLAAEFVRLSRGWIIVFTDDRSLGAWGESIQEAGGSWVRTMSWVKTSPMPQLTADRPGSGEEFILLAHSGKRKLAWNGGGRSSVFRGPRDLGAYHPNQKPLWLMQELLGLFSEPGELVLDPFAGSASTGVAALITERILGLTAVDNIGCPKCAKALAQHQSGRLALPSGLGFVGIERDPQVLPTAKARLAAALKGRPYDPELPPEARQQ